MSLTISIIEIESDKKCLLSEFTFKIYMTKMSLKHTLFSFIVIVNKILTKTEVQLTKDSAHKTAYHYSSTTTTPGTAIQSYID